LCADDSFEYVGEPLRVEDNQFVQRRFVGIVEVYQQSDLMEEFRDGCELTEFDATLLSQLLVFIPMQKRRSADTTDQPIKNQLFHCWSGEGRGVNVCLSARKRSSNNTTPRGTLCGMKGCAKAMS